MGNIRNFAGRKIIVSNMGKTYQDIETEPLMAAEPLAEYNVFSSYHAPSKDVSARERVMANTMSVDEYFDELIAHVHEDYANL
jgi:hypothetical protein